MKILAWVSWAVLVVWLVLVVLGALEFQDLYGGSSGLQVVVLGSVVGLVLAVLGWWAYRRARP